LNSLDTVKDAVMKALSLGGKVELAWGNVISSLGIDPGPEFAEMTSGQAKAQHVANLYIKAITGAQMSEREASRLLKAIPSPKDRPHQWKAKLEAAIEIARMTMKHYEDLIAEYGGMGNISRKEAREIEEKAFAYSKQVVDDFEERIKEEEGFGGGVVPIDE
jgi:hypothetical protein